MSSKLIFVALLLTTAKCCELNSTCQDCILSSCEFVLTKEKTHLCVKDSFTVSNIKTVATDVKGCKRIQFYFKKFGNLAVLSSIPYDGAQENQAPTIPPSTMNPSTQQTSATMQPPAEPITVLPTVSLSTTPPSSRPTMHPLTSPPFTHPTMPPLIPLPITHPTMPPTTPTIPPSTMQTSTPIPFVATTSKQLTPPTPANPTTPPTMISSTKLHTASTTELTTTTTQTTATTTQTTTKTTTLSPTNNDKANRTTKQNISHVSPSSVPAHPAIDWQLEVPEIHDVPELFYLVPTCLECKDGIRNETQLFRYASAMCSIAGLSDRIGYANFSSTEAGWLMSNQARRFNGTCAAIRRYRKKCRIPDSNRQRRPRPGMVYGPRSWIFGQVKRFLFCNPEEKKESDIHRLARIICYAGDLFPEVQRTAQLGIFDLAWGLGNPSYRYQPQCDSLFRRKQECFM